MTPPTAQDPSPEAPAGDAAQYPTPLRDVEDAGRFSRARMLATDVDGTLTTGGEIGAAVLETLDDLADAGIEVLPVSGRSSGEVLGLARYLPGVRRAIAENGQVLVEPDRPVRRLLPGEDREALERRAQEIAERCLGAPLALAPDACFRLGDIAFERADREDEALDRLRSDARDAGLACIWSNVHVHFSEAPPDKGAALVRLLAEWDVEPDRVVTLGDAPNDAGLFDRSRFGVTVGTADVIPVLEMLPSTPEFVSSFREAGAVAELAQLLLGRGSGAD